LRVELFDLEHEDDDMGRSLELVDVEEQVLDDDDLDGFLELELEDFEDDEIEHLVELGDFELEETVELADELEHFVELGDVEELERLADVSRHWLWLADAELELPWSSQVEDLELERLDEDELGQAEEPDGEIDWLLEDVSKQSTELTDKVGKLVELEEVAPRQSVGLDDLELELEDDRLGQFSETDDDELEFLVVEELVDLEELEDVELGHFEDKDDFER